ncbi:MAG: excinuclease ABC subunit UvrC [Rhodocyclaceae bacterium]|nr:excinuclease ABC subunit UvrC [Rhodocyclaceae bacterium]
MWNASAFLATLTESPGVYRMLDDKERVLYVGKAKNLKKRVSSYFRTTGHSPRITLMLQQVANVDITATRSETEALLLENTLIKKLAPKYNILFRDDKSYPYIALSGDAFPRLTFHRGAFEKTARYFGPFPNAAAVREGIQRIQKAFLLRTCESSVFAHRSRPCLMHQIKRCKAPCVGSVSAEIYAQDVRLAELFLRGRHDEIIERLTNEMQAASESLHFERAAVLRDQVRALQAILHRQYMSVAHEEDTDIIVCVLAYGEMCVNLAMVRGGLHLGDRAFFPQSGETEATAAEGLDAFVEQHYGVHVRPSRVITGSPCNEKERAWIAMAEQNAELALTSRRHHRMQATARLEALRDVLGLSDHPRRIECFDISHTMGEGTVASCVVCVEGAMKRSDYRHFNIVGIAPGDDCAAMRQVLLRRYGKVVAGEGQAPDLILIDGGSGQQASARQALHELHLEHWVTIGIAKGEDRKPGRETLLVHGRQKPLQLEKDSAGFHLIQEIRDEAHRFAVAGHRARRAKPRGRSKLEEVVGIGPAKRKSLLAYFGGLEGVLAATAEDMERVKGVGRNLASEIYRQLH